MYSRIYPQTRTYGLYHPATKTVHEVQDFLFCTPDDEEVLVQDFSKVGKWWVNSTVDAKQMMRDNYVVITIPNKDVTNRR